MSYFILRGAFDALAVNGIRVISVFDVFLYRWAAKRCFGMIRYG